MTGPPDTDPAVEAEAAGALDQLVHMAHHDDTDALAESIYGMAYDDMPVVLVAALDLLSDRDALLAYVRKLGWVE